MFASVLPSIPESTLYCKINRTSHVIPLRASEMVSLPYTSVIILSGAKYSALGCKAAPAVVRSVHRFQAPVRKQIHTWLVSAGLGLVARAHTATPTHTNTSNIYKKTHAVSSLHTTTSTETRENVVGRGERDCVGGSRRKDGERGRGRVGVSGTWLSV